MKEIKGPFIDEFRTVLLSTDITPMQILTNYIYF